MLAIFFDILVDISFNGPRQHSFAKLSWILVLQGLHICWHFFSQNESCVDVTVHAQSALSVNICVGYVNHS
jgi:hypothetical protein